MSEYRYDQSNSATKNGTKNEKELCVSRTPSQKNVYNNSTVIEIIRQKPTKLKFVFCMIL